ncbi:MAG TPA: hypothetical protein VF977_04345 [Candidatus Binatia bacterium]
MNRLSPGVSCAVLLGFFAGFLVHLLYQRWNPAPEQQQPLSGIEHASSSNGSEPGIYRVSFVPLAPAAEEVVADLPTLVAREVERIRGLAGRQARIRGRVFRVGHATKSNTYFLNFGPSREALTAVIFSSAAELLEKNKQAPKNFENREVEITGFIKDHPQYGLEVVIEDPKQIKLMN